MDGGYTHESALKAALELLSSPTPPDAVFATDSMKLLGLYRAADELNLMIPEQVVIAGYSDPMLSLILTPAPCGFDIPTRKLGKRAAIFFRRIAGHPAPQKCWLIPIFTGGLAVLKPGHQCPEDPRVRTRNLPQRPHSGSGRFTLVMVFPFIGVFKRHG